MTKIEKKRAKSSPETVSNEYLKFLKIRWDHFPVSWSDHWDYKLNHFVSIGFRLRLLNRLFRWIVLSLSILIVPNEPTETPASEIKCYKGHLRSPSRLSILSREDSKLFTSMLVTDVGDQMCCWQVLDVGDRFGMLVIDLIYWENRQHNEKSREYIDSATNIWNQSPTLRHQHNDVTNITLEILEESDVGDIVMLTT